MVMFYFNMNEFGFLLEFLGCVVFVCVFCVFGGVVLYNGYFKRVSFKKMFLWIFILGIAFGFI